MAKTYINPRGSHVAPGIYTNEIEVQSSVKSLGITSLGLVGETVKGPAFEPIKVSNWNEFKSTFGGTNPELFKGSQYPKYEAPYIAKEYLSESENLNVVRVLGLSGYNAGPAWVIRATKNGSASGIAVAVLRSRGWYDKYNTGRTSNDCSCVGYDSDIQRFYVGEKKPIPGKCFKPGFNKDALTLKPYNSLNTLTTCEDGEEKNGYSADTNTGYTVSAMNRGRFVISGFTGYEDDKTDFKYAVSLNPADKDYILKVLGTSQSDGDAPVYVESLYDVALEQAIDNGDVTEISSILGFYDVYYPADYCLHEPVYGLMRKQQNELKRTNVGERYLADNDSVAPLNIKAVRYNYATN